MSDSQADLTVSVCVENNRKAAEIWQAMLAAALRRATPLPGRGR